MGAGYHSIAIFRSDAHMQEQIFLCELLCALWQSLFLPR